MKKVKIILVGMMFCLLPLVASAATCLCWDADGYKTNLCFNPVAPGVYEVNGYIDNAGPTGKIPVSGTAVVTGKTITVGFLLDQAHPNWYSVVWEFFLDRASLNGVGYWRWCDSSAEGNFSSVTRVPCSPSSLQDDVTSTPKDLTPLGKK